MGVGLGGSYGYSMEICHGDIANKMGISLAFAGFVDFRVTVPNSLIGAFKKTKKRYHMNHMGISQPLSLQGGAPVCWPKGLSKKHGHGGYRGLFINQQTELGGTTL